jgi:hypothetical protein
VITTPPLQPLLSLQWLSDNGAGNGVFTSVGGATTNSLVVNPSGLAADVTYSYELIASNSIGSVTSAPVTVTLATVPEPPSQGVSWGLAATGLGDSDVATNGTGIVAFGAVPGGVTVNGVLFNVFAPADVVGIFETNAGGLNSAEAGITNVTGAVTTTLTEGNGGAIYWYYGFGSVNPPFSSLSTSYQTLLAYANGDDGEGDDPWTLQFSGLTPGHVYEVQIWADDSRIYGGDRYDALSDSFYGDPAHTIGFNDTGADGGIGQYIIGTTTADNSGTVSLTLQGSGSYYYWVGPSTQVNAFQLRELSPVVGGPVVNPPQPQSVLEYAGQNKTFVFTSSAAGSGPLSYQWIGDNGSGTFSAIAGATTNSLTVDTTGFAPAIYQYSLVVSNGSGVVTSSVARLTVANSPQGISWDAVEQVAGDSDVRTDGVGVVAFGAGPGSVTLNGVLFNVFAPPDAYPLQAGGFVQSAYPGITNVTGAVTTSVTIGGVNAVLYWYDAFGATVAPFASLSTNYQNLLGAGNGDYSANPWTLEFSGLTPGHAYELQLWVIDARGQGYRYETLSGGGSVSAPLLFNASESPGGLGSYVVGTTMPDANGNVVVTIVGNEDEQINAFQLRDLSVSSTLNIAQSGTNVVIRWTGLGGTLEQAPTVTGPWTTNSAASPYTVPASAHQEFYRVKLQ